MRRCLLIAVACLVPLGAVTSSATAKSPPTGTYECTISGMLFDKINIRSATTYKRFGKRGRYSAGSSLVTFPDGVKGYRIRFRTGPLKGFKGRWYKAKDGTAAGTHEIALENPESDDNFESIYCVRRK
jgi:hypothetical protein